MISITTVLLLIASLSVLYAEEWDLSTFQKNVLDDDRVWLVEFYSGMCGSCKEFNPIWAKVVTSMKSVATAKINIDKKGGMEVAQMMNVLDEGIPNVRLLRNKSSGSTGDSIVAGNPLTQKEVMTLVKGHVTGHARRDDGFYLKSA